MASLFFAAASIASSLAPRASGFSYAPAVGGGARFVSGPESVLGRRRPALYAGFGGTATKKKKSSTATKKKKSKKSSGLDEFRPAKKVDEDVPREVRKASLPDDVGPFGVAIDALEDRSALADRDVHPIDLDFPGLKVLHLDPPIFRVEGLLSEAECKDLIELTDTGRCFELPRASNTDGAGAASRRTSTTWYGRFREAAARPLVDRASKLFRNISADYFEEIQIARYLPGQEFKWHEDAFPRHQLVEGEGGQRMATLLVYLSGDADPDAGGATAFRDLGPDPPLKVLPKAGDALLFFPATFPFGQPDGRTVHAASPAKATKWVSQLWLHEDYYPTCMLEDNPRPDEPDA